MGEKKCPECKPGAPEYMNTYGDMMTLLLCFFVLLFAFSSLDTQKFKVLMVSFQGSLGVMPGGKTISPESLITDSRVNAKGSEIRYKMMAKNLTESLEKIEESQQNSATESTEEKNAEVKITQRGIEITLGDRTLFDIGKSELKSGAFNILDQVIKEIKGIENEIIIEGHTDNIPINTVRFPSNWELSTARSTTVLKYMLSKSKSLRGRISASGYADTKPLASNQTLKGRQKNRRVDIVILKSINERIEETLINKTIEGGD